MHHRASHHLRLVLPLVAATWTGCAGHSDLTREARTALDAGRAQEALDLYNEELDVDSGKDVPNEIEDDHVLFLLDRSLVLQQLNQYTYSSRDLEIADKQIETLDFSRDTLDDLGKYMFSDEAGPYQAPPYEKLLINTMNMMNYLARGDLQGARVEARRFATMQTFIAEHESHARSLSGPGSYLAGFVFEKSRRYGEALRYYDEALQYGEFDSLAEPIQRLAQRDSYRSPRLKKYLPEGPAKPATAGTADDGTEILVITNYGRVPPKIAKRIPIGLALTLASRHLGPSHRSQANQLAAQGLVTWVNFPTLGKARGEYGVPAFQLDGQARSLEGILAVDVEAQRAWKEVEGTVIASAITRLVTRVVAGEAARQVSGGGVVGALLSLGTQATLTATDTPDTRSWATLPARIAFGRVRVPPGKHEIVLSAGGQRKRTVVDVPAGGWSVVMLTALR